MLWDLFVWSWRQSKKRQLESLLIVILIALGTGTLVTVLSVYIHQILVEQEFFDQAWYRKIGIFHESTSLASTTPFVFVGSEENWDSVIMDERKRSIAPPQIKMGLTELEELQRRLPDSMSIFLEEYRTGTIPQLSSVEKTEIPPFPGQSESDILVIGTTPEYFNFTGLPIQKGSSFIMKDLEDENKVVILSYELANVLFDDIDPLGQTVSILINYREPEFYTVIGVLAPKHLADVLEKRSVYIPATTLDIGFGRLNFNQFWVGVDLGVDLDKSLEKIKDEAYLLWGNEVRVNSNIAQYKENLDTSNQNMLVIGTFTSVALFIGMVSILNLMLSRVLKRVNHMGLSMALGASKKIIFLQFMVEASFLGFLGAFLGIGFSLVFVSLFKITTLSVFKIQLALGVLIGFLVTLFFGTYPAYLGSRVNPVDALRTD